jgi:alpha-glucosidase
MRLLQEVCVLPKQWLLVLLLISASSSAQSGWQSLGNVNAVKEIPGGVDLEAGQGHLKVVFVAPNLVRLTYSGRGNTAAVDPFAVLPQPPLPSTPAINQVNDAVTLSTSALGVKIDRTPLRVSFLDPSGHLISEDQPGYPVAFNGTAFRVWKAMPDDEHYFGLGDKSGPLDHRNQAYTMWNTDAWGWQESTDPLYKDVPFFLATRHGAAYGIFLDNTFRSTFDFGKESRDFYSFGADGGPLDYYFMYGPSPKEVVQTFTSLVGRIQLPPLFALGFQQSRYSYEPESQVREIASEFRKRRIPLDVLYLDIDYQQDNRPFSINRQKFPNFEGMVKDLKDEGIKLVLITDLHIAKAPGTKPYDQGLQGGDFVKNPDGSVYVGKVWPGDTVFPDFTRDAARQFWGTLYSDFTKMGVRGFWNDMNEPSIFERADKTMPLDTVHYFENRKTDHREAHNILGMENVRATYEGLLKLQPDIRPLVLTRAAFAGAQRFAATWTGDNTSSWDHMRISTPQLLNLGLSGFGFVGDDIGGFVGGPTPELLTRWMELGAFNPFYRNHAEKGTRMREPWVDGPEHETIRRRYIEERYRLLPYIYTGMEENSRTGVPFMRPMFLEFPNNPSLETNGTEFMFGGALLVAPKNWPFIQKPYEVALPEGDWYDYWTGEEFRGEQDISVDPPMQTLPVFVRAGAIIPEQPVVQYVGERPDGPLDLRVYPGKNCSGDLYVDDGNTLAYQHGDFMRLHFSCDAASDHVDLRISAPEGPFPPWFSKVRVLIEGTTENVRDISIDGKAVEGWRKEHRTVLVPPFALAAAAHTIHVAYR